MIHRTPGTKRKSRVLIEKRSGTPPQSIFRYNGAVQQIISSGADIPVALSTEQIAYSNTSYPGSNFCKHIKYQRTYEGDATKAHFNHSIDPGLPGYEWEYYGGHTDSYAAHSMAEGVCASAVNFSDEAFAPDPQVAINDAFARVRPDLTELSLPNFLLEAGEMRQLAQIWKTNLSLAKNLAGAHLNYKFGWKPTIGDLQAMVDSVLHLREKLRAFREQCGKSIRKAVKLQDVAYVNSGQFYMQPNQFRVDWNGFHKKSVIAHIVYQPQPLAVMGQMDMFIRGMLDALGVELNPRIIWDSLPFTFVIDWFLGVGAWLEGFKIDTLNLPIVCIDACVQYKTEFKAESRLTSNPIGYPTNTYSRDVYPGWVTWKREFQRVAILPSPDIFQGLGWKQPTLGQRELLVSLVTVLNPFEWRTKYRISRSIGRSPLL